MPLYNSDTADLSLACFAARVPVLTASEKVFGYKLLYSAGFNRYLSPVEDDAASRSVIDLSSLIGFNTLSNDLPAFIVTSREALVEEYLILLPFDKMIAEIPASVPADAEVIQACERLKAAGCRIALGNYRADDPRRELRAMADFLKIDIQAAPLPEISKLIQCNSGNLRLIAERVETREDFEFCKGEGFSFFEGYFFRKPEILRARGARAARTVFLRLLREVSQPVLDWKELEDIFKSDPTLYLRLLRYLNSAIFGLQGEVKTINHALTILGEDEIRRWCRLTGMLEISTNRPSDLALTALVRARFAELIGAKVDSGGADLFLVGLLSLMDAILEMPMREVLEGLPLDESARTALLENKGRLSPIYELILAVEAGIWSKVAELAFQLEIGHDFIAQSQWNAMKWAQSIASAA